MPIVFTDSSGQDQEVDLNVEAQARFGPKAYLKSYDKSAKKALFFDGEKDQEFNLGEELTKAGMKLRQDDVVNTPETASDISPLGWRERYNMGLLTREAEPFQDLISKINPMNTGSPREQKVQQARAMARLKQLYEDAVIVDGSIRVKDKGVWKLADSSSDSLGEDAAEFIGNAGLNIALGVAGGALGTPMGPAGIAGGAIIGSALGELAEEALAVGFLGAAFEPQKLIQDIQVDAFFNTLGLGIEKAVVSPLAAKLTGLTGEKMAATAARESISKEGMEAIVAEANKEAFEFSPTRIRGLLNPQITNEEKKAVIDSVLLREQQIKRGFVNTSTVAADESKDFIAKAISSLSSGISEKPLRESMDTPEKAIQMLKYRNEAATVSDVTDLYRPLAETFQKIIDNADDMAQSRFGKDLNRIKKATPDSFRVDLEGLLNVVRQKGYDAAATVPVQDRVRGEPQSTYPAFKYLTNRLENIIDFRKSRGLNTTLSGPDAFSELVDLDFQVKTKLKELGAHKWGPDSPQGPKLDIIEGLLSIKNHIWQEKIRAAESSTLTQELDFKRMNAMYRTVQNSLRVLQTGAFSAKKSLDYARKIAAGKGTLDEQKALVDLIRELGEDRVEGKTIKDLVSDMYLRTAGIESQEWLALPETIKGAATRGAGVATIAGAGTTVGGPVGGGLGLLAGAAAVASPRIASSMARGTSKIAAKTVPIAQGVKSGLSKAAIIAGLPEAKAAARGVLGIAQSANFLRHLPKDQRLLMLQNPSVFGQFLQQASDLSSSLKNASPEAAMELSIKLQQKQQEMQGVP